MCGGSAAEALARLTEMERETNPNPPRSPQPPSIPPCQGGRKALSSLLDNANTTTPSPDKGRAGEGLGRAGEGLACLPYSKNLVPLARENRRNLTPAETRIWNEVLRKRQLARFKFLRQKPIDHFIVDFYCSKLGLVIEIDGDSHAETAEYDRERTRVLGAYGLEVVRYTNDEVLRNIEGVYEDLLRRISNLPRSANPPQSPFVRGEERPPRPPLLSRGANAPSPDKGRAGEGLENAVERS
jgi:very-short-patch-repair endonuclease